jgi:hypothetical protein
MWHHDMPVRQRSHPHEPGAPRSQRHRVTRKRRRACHIPLASADALEIDRWAETPVTFINSRRLKPIERFRDDLYL